MRLTAKVDFRKEIVQKIYVFERRMIEGREKGENVKTIFLPFSSVDNLI